MSSRAPAAVDLGDHARVLDTPRSTIGRRWGEGAARCFSLEGDLLLGEGRLTLEPIPDCYVCPISRVPMEDPIATVDGCVYDRASIERWIRERRHQRLPVTSPLTGLPLPSLALLPLVALQKAIEAFLAHRPELQGPREAAGSAERAAEDLRSQLHEKQARWQGAQAELGKLGSALREAGGTNRRLRSHLRRKHAAHLRTESELDMFRKKLAVSEATSGALRHELPRLQGELEAARARIVSLERERVVAAAAEAPRASDAPVAAGGAPEVQSPQRAASSDEGSVNTVQTPARRPSRSVFRAATPEKTEEQDGGQLDDDEKEAGKSMGGIKVPLRPVPPFPFPSVAAAAAASPRGEVPQLRAGAAPARGDRAQSMAGGDRHRRFPFHPPTRARSAGGPGGGATPAAPSGCLPWQRRGPRGRHDEDAARAPPWVAGRTPRGVRSGTWGWAAAFELTRTYGKASQECGPHISLAASLVCKWFTADEALEVVASMRAEAGGDSVDAG